MSQPQRILPDGPKRNARAVPHPDIFPASGALHVKATEIADALSDTATERERSNTNPGPIIDVLRKAGLLNLLIPAAFGGAGGTLGDAVRIVADISRGDASIGALLGFHYYVSAVPKLFDFKGDAEALQRKSAANNWFWANIHQPGQRDFVAKPTGDGGYTVSGSKRWATGFPFADVTTVIARRADANELLFAVIPTKRKGLTHRDDWDHLGLRLTGTVTVDFDNVRIEPGEVIHSTHASPVVTFPPFYTTFAGLLYAAVFLGATRGGLERARLYVHDRPTARKISGVEKPSQDPLAQYFFGKSWRSLTVAESFVYATADEAEAAYRSRRTFTAQQRGELAAKATSARAFAADVALKVSPRLYEITGTSASSNAWGFDRHWRDARTLSLHDPIVYSVRNVGDNFVNGVAHEAPVFAT